MGNFDESDHIAAGFLMKNGRSLYAGSFSHHFPFPYYWVYLFTPFWSAMSPARTLSVFRLSLLILYLICYVLVFLSFKNRKTKYGFSLWIFIVSLFFVVYHGYVVISETFDAVFISSIAWIVLPILLKWEKPSRYTHILLILFSSLAFWTQPLMAILLPVPFLIIRDRKQWIKLFAGALVVNLLPLLAFHMTGQLYDFLFQGIYFNLSIYPAYYLDSMAQGSKLLQSALLFIKNEYKLLTGISNPLQWVQFIFHLSFLWILYRIVRTRNIRIISLFLLILLASRLREVKAVIGVPFDSGLYPFIMFASACFIYLLADLFQAKSTKIRFAGGTLLVFAVVANFLTSRQIMMQSLRPGYNYHVFWSYRQDRGAIMKSLSLPSERILIYPHDVELYYFADRMPPDRFTYWFPWINAVADYRKERLDALNNKPPSVLYIGNLTYKGSGNYYAEFFPGMTKNYIQVMKDNKKTGIWIRSDLRERLADLQMGD